jgi:tetratricopeptide (TPR) repeat protein
VETVGRSGGEWSRRSLSRARHSIQGMVAVMLLGLSVSPAVAQRAGAPVRPESTTVERAVASAHALERAGRTAEAEARYRRAIAEARATGDSLGLAAGEYRLGLLFWSQSRQDSAVAHLLVARDLRRSGDPVEYARVLNGLGAANYQAGLYEPAIRAFAEAEQLRRDLGDTLGLVRTLTNIGKTYQDWGQLASARTKLRDAVQLATGSPKWAAALGYAYHSLALVSIDLAELDSAERLIGQSIAAYTVPGALTSRADSVDAAGNALTARGHLLLSRGEFRAARVVLDSALASAVLRGSVRGQALTLLHLGECARRLGDEAEARRRFSAALTASGSVNQRVLMLQALRQLAVLEQRRGRAAEALAYQTRYMLLHDSVFDQDAAQRVASHEARLEVAAARRDNALLQAEQRAQDVVISRQRVAFLLTLGVLAIVSTLIVLLVRATRAERARSADLSRANADLAQVNDALRATMAEVRTLSGLIPICANCKSVRDDEGYWQAVETFVSKRSDARFSHGICQSCGPELYGDLWPSTAELHEPVRPTTA